MTKPVPKFLVTCTVIALAVVAALLMYDRYTTRPWTRDAQVRANIVGIAPLVAGPIIQIPVVDNQVVRKGQLLFEIDPAPFVATLNNSKAKLQQAEASRLQTEQDLQRMTELYKTQVVDQKTYQDAQDSYAAAAANVAAAQADVVTSQLNLDYTKVVAPVDGYLTNVNTSPGTYVYGGQQLLALVDASSFWIAAYFKETQLKHINEGDKVRLTLMGHTGQPFDGEVKSVGWGVFLEDGSTDPQDLLPIVSQTIDWVRLPQRFPVRIHVTGEPPIPLRIGQTVSAGIQ